MQRRGHPVGYQCFLYYSSHIPFGKIHTHSLSIYLPLPAHPHPSSPSLNLGLQLLSQAGSHPQGSFCLHLPGPGTTGLHRTPGWLCGCWHPNSGSHDYIAPSTNILVWFGFLKPYLGKTVSTNHIWKLLIYV